MAFLITSGMIHFTCKSGLTLSVLLKRLTSNRRSTEPLQQRRFRSAPKNNRNPDFALKSGIPFARGRSSGHTRQQPRTEPLSVRGSGQVPTARGLIPAAAAAQKPTRHPRFATGQPWVISLPANAAPSTRLSRHVEIDMVYLHKV